MSYALFVAPAALVVAVLTLILVPILSLAVFVVGLFALAAAAAVVSAKGIAALTAHAGPNRRRRRSETAVPQPLAEQATVAVVSGDSERSLSCS